MLNGVLEGLPSLTLSHTFDLEILRHCHEQHFLQSVPPHLQLSLYPAINESESELCLFVSFLTKLMTQC